MISTDIKLGDCLSMIENGVTIKQKEGASGYPITRIETLSNDRFNRDRLGYADIENIEAYYCKCSISNFLFIPTLFSVLFVVMRRMFY
jgi:hypothetical protein